MSLPCSLCEFAILNKTLETKLSRSKLTAFSVLVSPILTEGNAPSTSCVEIIFVWCLTLTKMIKIATTTNNREKIRYFIQLDISSRSEEHTSELQSRGHLV